MKQEQSKRVIGHILVPKYNGSGISHGRLLSLGVLYILSNVVGFCEKFVFRSWYQLQLT